MSLSRALVLVLALTACGSTPEPEASPRPPPIAPPVDLPPPAPVPPPARVTLPYELARGSALPAVGTPERALLQRWASLLLVNLASEEGRLYFRAERTDLSLLEGTTLISLSGSGGDTPRASGGTVFVLEEDGAPGRVLDLEVWTSIAVTDDPRTLQPLTPWLHGASACDDASMRARYAARHALGLDVPGGEPCTDLMPQLAATLLAHADPPPVAPPLAVPGEAPVEVEVEDPDVAAERREDAVRRFLTELVHVALPNRTLDFLARSADVHGARSRGAEFVTFLVTRDETGLHAEGTVAFGGTCMPLVPYDRFALSVTDTTLALEHATIARQTLTTRCL